MDKDGFVPIGGNFRKLLPPPAIAADDDDPSQAGSRAASAQPAGPAKAYSVEPHYTVDAFREVALWCRDFQFLADQHRRADYGNVSRFYNHSCEANMAILPVYIDEVRSLAAHRRYAPADARHLFAGRLLQTVRENVLLASTLALTRLCRRIFTIFAERDIDHGAELTIRYASAPEAPMDGQEVPANVKPCLCGAKGCHGYLFI